MGMILLESLRPNAEENVTFFLASPDLILECDDLAEVNAVLHELEARIREGYSAIGFLCYEAGFAFLPGLSRPKSTMSGLPLVWFALTRNLQTLPCGQLPPGFHDEARDTISDLQLDQNYSDYAAVLERLKAWIEKGHTYQVNYTMRYRGAFHGSTRALYCRLRERQKVNYAAYLETPDWAIASLSPELFFRSTGFDIFVRPMKGTAPRGRTTQEDLVRISELQQSAKETSENLMIVDMLRNDLGRICEPGSVLVTDPMRVERYETLLQMVTSIKGTLQPQTSIVQVLHALFPSGSVTGAPKVRTMQIIDELESSPRGIYTGAIGVIHQGTSIFNVAIRTVTVDRCDGRIEMGVGGGILYEADPHREYQECLLKGRFLTAPLEKFSLIETMLWTSESGVARLPFHLDRLSDSADYFLFPFDRRSVERAIVTAISAGTNARRIRLLLDSHGEIKLEVSELDPLPGPPYRVRFANETSDSTSPFAYHKTTHREVYDRELAMARSEGFVDAIFHNEKGEITEGAISNVFVRKGDIYSTPPLKCGVLAGTYRRFLLETRPVSVEERVLRKEDLIQADEVFLTNALRGLLRVQLSL